MSYTVFARKYRPQKFDDVLGQEHITRTLRNAIEQNRIAHAYIFVGPRGTGKTSTARIFAKALNCTGGPKADFDVNDDICTEIAEGRSLDVIEIDGASNNGVEQVRELRDNVRFAPARGKFKIYIIDEVHMLSTQAFNALLKTLEEPPAHAKFMLATTDVQKVLPTILSRCQRFDLRRIPTATIAKHLLWIATQENFTLDPAAAEAVARGAEGGLRDAESMLDQLVAFCGAHIAETDVLSIFGFTGTQTVAHLCDCILKADASAALGTLHEQAEAGKDLSRLMGDLISHLRNLLVLKADPAGLEEELSSEAIQLFAEQADVVSMEKLLGLIEQFASAEGRMKWAPNKKMHFEVAVIRAIQTLQSATLTEVLATLTAIRGGTPLPAAPAPAAPRPVAPKPAPAPVAKPSPIAKIEPPAVAAPKPAAKIEPPAPKPEPTAKIAEPPPAPAPAKLAPVLDPAALWPQFVTAVRRDRALIAPWLECGSLAEITGTTAVLAFPYEQVFAKDCLAKDHAALLSEILSSIAGQRLTLHFETRSGIVPAAVATTPEPPKRDPMDEFKDDPLIQKALEIFKAEILPA